jgi:hypothetical protein
MQPSQYNHDYGPATTSSHVPSSSGPQNGVWDGSANTPHLPNLGSDLPGHFKPQDATAWSLWSDCFDFDPGYYTHETLATVVPVQGSEVETHASGFGFSMENFSDESPFNTATPKDSELNFEFPRGDFSQQEAAGIEEYATVIKEEGVREASKSPIHWDNYAGVSRHLASDSPLKSEEDNEISQKRWEPMSQASGIVASRPVGTLIRNEKTYLGQPINVL